MKSDLVGGRAAYFFAWQPDEESPWAAYLIAGAERVAVETGGGSVGPGAGRRGGRLSTDAVPTNLGPGGGRWRSRSTGPWPRSTSSTPSTRGSRRVSRTTCSPVRVTASTSILPQFVWQPLVHVSIKGGAGYFQEGGEGQATFMLRVMVTQPSPRKNFDDRDPNPGRDRRSRGRIRPLLPARCLAKEITHATRSEHVSLILNRGVC